MNKDPLNKHLLVLEKQALQCFIKTIQRKRFPLNRLILFGSKARGDSTPDSDIDLLAVTKTNQAQEQLYREVASILSKFGVYLSVKAFTQQEFEKLNRFNTPFMENIRKEGVTLWRKQ